MRGPEAEVSLAVDLDEIAAIELIVARRLRERTAGEHRSRADGAGFDFVGLRDWHSGDRMAAIDWPQSTITNFSPLVVREFDQPSTATVVAVADLSLSTRCGIARSDAAGRTAVPIASGKLVYNSLRIVVPSLASEVFSCGGASATVTVSATAPTFSARLTLTVLRASTMTFS